MKNRLLPMESLRLWLFRSVLLLSIFSFGGEAGGHAPECQKAEATEWVARRRADVTFLLSTRFYQAACGVGNGFTPHLQHFEEVFRYRLLQSILRQTAHAVWEFHYPKRLIPPNTRSAGEGATA